MWFDDQLLDDIRNRINISDVIGKHVVWDRRKSQPARGDYWACCPFHEEKTPSFRVSDQRGRYYCFGCQASGDVFSFLQQTEGVSFPQAVERFAAELGLELPERDSHAQERSKKRASLYEIMDLANRFFQDNLQHAEGAKARHYLRSRGLSLDTYQAFGVGYAPNSRNALKTHLSTKGVSNEQMLDAGLIVAGSDIPVSYDRFRDRVMFPIADTRGRVIAFGGRALSSDIPAKYLNSPETPLFSKGHVLYNYHEAQKFARKGAKLLVVEGYMDVITCKAHGLDAAVAPLGTALTQSQITLLWRISDEPILCFDGDQAGQRAANRAADLILGMLKPGKTVRFVFMPSGQDPDDLLKTEGRAVFNAFLNKAKPLSSMIWSREVDGGIYDTPEQRASLEERIRKLVYSISDINLRRHYEQDFRERFKRLWYTNSSIYKNNGAARYSFRKNSPRIPYKQHNLYSVSRRLEQSPLVTDVLPKANTVVYTPRDALLLMVVINHPNLLNHHDEAFSRLVFKNQKLAQLHMSFLDLISENQNLNRTDVYQKLKQRGLKNLLDELTKVLSDCGLWRVSIDVDDADAEQGWIQAFALYERDEILAFELKEAEKALAKEATESNLARLVEIQKQIASNQHLLDSIKALDEFSNKDRQFSE